MKKSSILPILLGLALAACGEEPVGKTEKSVLEGEGYTIIDYRLARGGSETLVFTNLGEHDRILAIPFLARTDEVNVSLQRVLRIDASWQGGPVAARAPRFGRRTVAETLLPDDRPSVDLDAPTAGLPQPPARRQRIAELRPRAFAVGQTNLFHVIDDFDSPSKTVEVPARLLAVGTHCLVYSTLELVDHSNCQPTAERLAEIFDSRIYPVVTTLFGYEWGGDPAKPEEAGGIDGEGRVYLLFNARTKNPPGGYFSSIDQYLNSQFSHEDGRFSNEKELVYGCLNLAYLDRGSLPLSLFAHEFQHLVNHNQFRRRIGTSQRSMFNEACSQLAEELTGCGPDIYRLRQFQTLPSASASVWKLDGLPYPVGHAYGIGYAVYSYAAHRFGLELVGQLMRADTIGIPGVEQALGALGYREGYAALVLDTLTAHWLDRDQFSHPPRALHPGDIGIRPHGGNLFWNDTSAATNEWMLHGPAVDFHDSYPRGIDVSLHDYGGACHEFACGAGGRLTLHLSGIADQVRLRLVHLRPADSGAEPRIDGYTSDWSGRTLTVMTDPTGDNDRNNSNNPTGVFGTGCSDLTRIEAFVTNSVLFLAIETAAPPLLADASNRYMVRLFFGDDSERDKHYQLYLQQQTTPVYIREPFTNISVPLDGIRYRFGRVLEARIPLGIFPVAPPNPFRLRAYAYQQVAGDWRYDYQETEMSVSW